MAVSKSVDDPFVVHAFGVAVGDYRVAGTDGGVLRLGRAHLQSDGEIAGQREIG
jgi:hypothetical protein